jgi:hypothetical protein
MGRARPTKRRLDPIWAIASGLANTLASGSSYGGDSKKSVGRPWSLTRNGVELRGTSLDSQIVRAWHVSTSQLTPAVRRQL